MDTKEQVLYQTKNVLVKTSINKQRRLKDIYISERNFPKLINALLKIEQDLWDSCASDEIVAIIDRFEKKVKDKTILTDIIAKVLKIGLHIYRAIKIGAISFENFGDVLGRIVFTLLSDKCPE